MFTNVNAYTTIVNGGCDGINKTTGIFRLPQPYLSCQSSYSLTPSPHNIQ